MQTPPELPPRATASGSYIVQFDEKTALVRRPLGVRIIFGVAGVITVILVCPLILLFVPGAMGVKPPQGIDVIIILVPILAASALAAALVAMGGPSEMRFDWVKRKYEYKRGLPLIAWTTRGPLEDFDYLYQTVHVVGFYGGGSAQHLVYLSWKKPPRIFGVLREWDFIAYSGATLDVARDVARSVGAIMGIPAEWDSRGKPSLWRKLFLDS